MACPFRVVLVVLGAIWAVIMLQPSKLGIVFQPVRMKWYLAAVVVALHVDLVLQLGYTQCAFTLVASRHSDLAESLGKFFRSTAMGKALAGTLTLTA
jgi:hypothetical protein